MSKTSFRSCPVNGYDIPGLERWLEKQAARGLMFDMTVGPFILFQRGEPVQFRFHLEPAPDRPGWEDSELNALYEQAGWRYLGLFHRNFAVFATEDLQAQAHTDPQVWDYVLKRFFRRKLLAGIGLALLNFFLLNMFWSTWFEPFYLRCFWAECIAAGLLRWVLTVLGLALADLAYLHGLFVLWRLHRRVKRGLPMTPAPGSRLSGALLALSTVPLFLVAVELAFLFFTHGYFPYDLADSNFVTLTEIEGEDFQLTGDRMYNMDYISYGYTPLTPKEWAFRQSGMFPWNDDGSENRKVPRLEIYITRYLLPAVAECRVCEWESYGRGGYRDLDLAYGLDQIRFYQVDGERNIYLILRRGGTVLRVLYRGEQDLTRFLPRFAEMLDAL